MFRQVAYCVSSGSLLEYCNLETFKPQCSNGEVIVIEDAIYGRRHAGKCIDADEASIFKDPRYFGCSNNVRQLLDARCSGRKSCEVRVPDAELEQDSPCHKGLKMFLEASYTCLSGDYIVIMSVI
jgi:Galactose binding lectin domain